MEKNKAYYEGLDKRTNEFKDWKKTQTIEPHKPKETVLDEEYEKEVEEIIEEVSPNTQEDLEAKHKENPTIETSVGAGDIVEKVAEVTGIKAVIEYFTPEGEDCGCEERKKKLNDKKSIVRHKRVECLTLAEYNYLKPLLSNNAPLTGHHVKKLLEIYARVFNSKIITTCNGCSMTKKLDELKAVLKTYIN